jgi:hypothetical protein
LPARFDDDAWTCSERTPPYYPDAVTLVPDPSVPDVLARIDTSAGCSIKDSFATLDLSDHGFRVLADAQWIVRERNGRERPDGAEEGWRRVRDLEGLASWEEAWRRGDGPRNVFRADLLDNDAVAILAAQRGTRVVAGAVLHKSSVVAGISNFFTDSGADRAGWSGCLALAECLCPATPFVGYAADDELVAARRNGFETAGPLRIWVLEE